MCGIWAVVGKFKPEQVKTFAHIANDVQGHRGPDGADHRLITMPDGRQVILGHQRLSIIELSDAGSQPMFSPDTGSALIFNGELYNYIELSKQLKSPPRSGSDSEVLLRLIDEVGMDRALQQSNGMWALLFVSHQNNSIEVARDRLGKKPFYVWNGQDRIVFASELKTVAALSGQRFKINTQALSHFIDYGLQDVTEESWLSGIVSIPAGATANIGKPGKSDSIVIRQNWTLTPSPAPKSLGDAVEQFRGLVTDSIRLRLRSDVPVGVTLSGGLDSSLIVANMVQQLGKADTVSAVSAIAPGQTSDESQHIKRVCEALGVKSHLVEVTWRDDRTFDLMDKVTWHNDAPLGSFSNIAFYELMRLARQDGIKVVLSGQGADESLCGYRKYFYWAVAEQLKRGRIDTALINLAGSLFSGTVLSQFSLADAGRYLPGANKAKSYLSGEVRKQNHRLDLGTNGKSVSDRQALDIQKYSVPFLTHYEDRGSMAHGVEVRLPFLDYRLVEFGIGLPLHFKIHRGWTKYIARHAYRGLLPDDVIFRRDKKGFTVPQRDVMRGALRGRLTELFQSDAEMYRRGLINKQALLEDWLSFISDNEKIWDRKIFAPWALETWLKSFERFLE